MQKRDPSAETVETFNRNAVLFAEKYCGLKDYDRFYERLLPFLPERGAFIDVACGPGNASAYISRNRPDVEILGVDMAPKMIQEAQKRVPRARFLVADCRHLDEIDGLFDAAAFCFGLNYLDDDGAQKSLAGLRSRLKTGGGLLLSTITGVRSLERIETSSTGDKVFMVYRTVDQVLALLAGHGFKVLAEETVNSPSNASLATRDLIALARKE